MTTPLVTQVGSWNLSLLLFGLSWSRKLTAIVLSCKNWSYPKVVPRMDFGCQKWSPWTTFGRQKLSLLFCFTYYTLLMSSVAELLQYLWTQHTHTDHFWQGGEFWQPILVRLDQFLPGPKFVWQCYLCSHAHSHKLDFQPWFNYPHEQPWLQPR